jgi:hypothetical protein
MERIRNVNVIINKLLPTKEKLGRKFQSELKGRLVSDQLNDILVCKSSLMNILLSKRIFWRTCETAVNNGSIPHHAGNKGKEAHSRKVFKTQVEPALKVFFDDMLLKLAGVRPTRYVRNLVKRVSGQMEVQNEVRDDNDFLELDPEWTKRRCFSMFCFDQEFKLKLDSKRRQTLEKRDDNVWKEGDQIFGRICSWPKFLSYWGENYSNLKVRKPGEDICALCYQFHLGNRLGKGASYCINTTVNAECVVVNTDDGPEDDDDDDIPISKAVTSYKKQQDTIHNRPLSEVITEL